MYDFAVGPFWREIWFPLSLGAIGDGRFILCYEMYVLNVDFFADFVPKSFLLQKFKKLTALLFLKSKFAAEEIFLQICLSKNCMYYI